MSLLDSESTIKTTSLNNCMHRYTQSEWGLMSLLDSESTIKTTSLNNCMHRYTQSEWGLMSLFDSENLFKQLHAQVYPVRVGLDVFA